MEVVTCEQVRDGRARLGKVCVQDSPCKGPGPPWLEQVGG